MFLLELLATTAFLTLVHAQKPAAIVVIEASHGGAGQGLTNTTVTIPLTSVYTNATALREVSTLYLVDSRNTPLSSVSCTPFKHDDGTGQGGLTFDSTTPSLLSTNTVEVGSIVCISTDISLAPPGLGGSSSSSAVAATTKTRVETRTQEAKTTGRASTTATETVAQTTQATTASPSVTQATGNAASSFALSGEVFGGLALAGFGLAFAL